MKLIVIYFMFTLICQILKDSEMLRQNRFRRLIKTNKTIIYLEIVLNVSLFFYAFYSLLLESLSKVSYFC